MESSRSAALEIVQPQNLATGKSPSITSDGGIAWGSPADTYAKFHGEYAASKPLRDFLGQAARQSANPITLIYDNTVKNAEVHFGDVDTTIKIPDNRNPFLLANNNEQLRQATEDIFKRYTTAQESAKYLAKQGVNVYGDLGVRPHELSHSPAEKLDPSIAEKIRSNAFDLHKEKDYKSELTNQMQQVLMDPQARSTYHEEWRHWDRKETLPENSKAFVPYEIARDKDLSLTYKDRDGKEQKSSLGSMKELLDGALPGGPLAIEIGGAKRDKTLVTENLKYIGPQAEEHAEAVRNFLEHAASVGDAHTTNLIERLHAHGGVLPNPPKNAEGRVDGHRFQEMLREQLKSLEKINEQEGNIAGAPVRSRDGGFIPHNSELITLDNLRNEPLKKIVTEAGISYNHRPQEQKTDYFNQSNTPIFTEIKNKITFPHACGEREMDVAMQIAKQKWHNKIQLHGSNQYLEKAYASAKKNGLDISNEPDVCNQLNIPPPKSLTSQPPTLTRS